MIAKKDIKLIKGLGSKKNRVKHQLFVIEGKKNVAELLISDYDIDSLFATDSWISENPNRHAIEVSDTELGRISNQKNPDEVLALVRIKTDPIIAESRITLVLDDINDPGNMGTIIRTCDWFGIRSIVCSNNSVDIYNPKVVQAAMGSIFRVSIIYVNLLEYLRAIKSPIYGAFMDGENVKEASFAERFHLVLGNEANGIKKEISQLVNKKVRIENIGGTAESLNVAVATSILLHELSS